MELLLCLHGDGAPPWLHAFARALPEASVRVWQPGDTAPADYAAVWRPPVEVLKGRPGLKAVFNLGAGVDAILEMAKREPDVLPESVPLIRIEDGGMAAQMVEYVMYAALRFMRRFDEYDRERAARRWTTLEAMRPANFPIAVMGLGQLGAAVARALAQAGWPVRGWSRTAKSIEGIDTYTGEAGLEPFLAGAKMLVNLLPSTPSTRGLIGHRVFDGLAHGAYLVNIARGAHVVEADLLSAIRSGRIAGAMLDVFAHEPLPVAHPFWDEPRIEITPHISAITLIDEGVEQMAAKMRALERGETVTGVVDRRHGY
ncbi:2-hydroxyacid dehydrogenase [Pararobbsia alpina]|uniref:Glyoxylate/hydroxypyruvate reductase A n=1 Tax=Pararobbsia alpina TaxID=621374 RepID=A0A6S7BGR6_9BURK|nr:glyoxylate/hydroxypyruvate reductase A [Pararobbsia alpina]CAB3799478.1 Glyoxylate/hydroxypyruvate reductase A [Pararobbsia alpina]